MITITFHSPSLVRPLNTVWSGTFTIRSLQNIVVMNITPVPTSLSFSLTHRTASSILFSEIDMITLSFVTSLLPCSLSRSGSSSLFYDTGIPHCRLIASKFSHLFKFTSAVTPVLGIHQILLVSLLDHCWEMFHWLIKPNSIDQSIN